MHFLKKLPYLSTVKNALKSFDIKYFTGKSIF